MLLVCSKLIVSTCIYSTVPLSIFANVSTENFLPAITLFLMHHITVVSVCKRSANVLCWHFSIMFVQMHLFWWCVLLFVAIGMGKWWHWIVRGTFTQIFGDKCLIWLPGFNWNVQRFWKTRHFFSTTKPHFLSCFFVFRQSLPEPINFLLALNLL